MSNIMDMPNGTKLRNKRSGTVYILQDYVNTSSRILYNTKYSGMSDYINENTQDDYEVAE